MMLSNYIIEGLMLIYLFLNLKFPVSAEIFFNIADFVFCVADFHLQGQG